MPRVVFTSHLAAVAPRGEVDVSGGTVREALTEVFAHHPRLAGYVLDDQGAVRKHVVIFVDNKREPNESVLDRDIGGDSEIYVLQALSGGSFPRET